MRCLALGLVIVLLWSHAGLTLSPRTATRVGGKSRILELARRGLILI